MNGRKIQDRKPDKFLLVITLLLTLSPVLLVGCAVPHIPSRIIYEDPVNYVRLEEDADVLAEWPPTHHAHPFLIESGTIRTILTGMKVQEHRTALQRWFLGESPLVPAFTDEEITLLSAQLAGALAEATYQERVTFYLSQPQTFARRIITTGGLYIHGRELHFLLGNWRIIYGIPAYGMIYDRRYPMRPTAAKGVDLLFQPADAVIPLRNSLIDGIFANAKDELVIDLTKLEPPEPVTHLMRRCADSPTLCSWEPS
ncbi:MAG: hypothetical protein JSS38_18820 [Nitrospira sp.]|nr:hypothetical protein [Nitrospira sp.]MBS0165278.1 hypothetical protein [Nitrospira sp.]